jgi:hypothetical protein
MSRERRIVRPYQGVDGFQMFLDDVRVEFGDRQIYASGLATASASDFMTQHVALLLADDELGRDRFAQGLMSVCDDAALKANDLEIVVVLRTPRLKLATLAWRCRLDELSTVEPRVDLSGDTRPAPLRAPIGGCTISVYIALHSEIPPEPLKPWRRGTWLARTHHKIRTNINEIGFTPLELTDEERQQHQLPPATLRFAVVEDPLNPDNGPESIRLYIDSDILSMLATNPRSGAAKALQTELYLSAMSAAVTESSRCLSADTSIHFDDIDGSIAARLIDIAVGDAPPKERGDHEQRFLGLLRNYPATFLAHIEARIPDFRKSTVSNLQGSTK